MHPKRWQDMREGTDYVFRDALAPAADVDIYMPVYNHAPYLRQAIESVVAQKTRFRWRLVISEDCSTDDSLRIISEYQSRYPDRIAAFFWRYNCGLRGLGSQRSAVVQRRLTAPYVATLEGDDYWTSPLKLERALSFLEAHPDYSCFAHNIAFVDENGAYLHPVFRTYPSLRLREEHLFSIENALNGELISQTGSLVHRNFMAGWPEETWDRFCLYHGNRDLLRGSVCAILGKVYVSRDIMSHYRVSLRASSFTARTEFVNREGMFYEIYRDLALFLREAYGVDFPFQDRAQRLLRHSRYNLYRRFDAGNLGVYLRLLWRVRVCRARLGEGRK